MLNAIEAKAADYEMRMNREISGALYDEKILDIYAEFRAFLAHEYASELPRMFEPILWDKVRRDDGRGVDYGRRPRYEDPTGSYRIPVYDELEIAYVELAGFVLKAVKAAKLEVSNITE